MIKVAVCGALGRMGSTVGRMVNESSDLELVGGIDVGPDPCLVSRLRSQDVSMSSSAK
jgi:dihydrodipicolinate reductase (EC 1.3.1.26)